MIPIIEVFMLEKIYDHMKSYWSIVVAFFTGIGLFFLVMFRMKKMHPNQGSVEYNASKEAKAKARDDAKKLAERKQHIEEKYDNMILDVEKKKAENVSSLLGEEEKSLTDMISKEFNIKNLDGK